MSEVLSAIDALSAVDPHSVPDAVLLAEIEGLLQARDRLDGLIARRLQVADSRHVTVAECGRTTRSWLVEEMRLSPVEAGQRMAVARALPFLATVGAALDAGDISAEHARAIGTCLRRLPQSWHADAEQILCEAARSVDPVTLGQVAKELRLRSGADEDREARALRMFDSRWATAVTTFEGMLRLEAMLDPESGRTLLAALGSLMPPTGADDQRTAAQRRADALIDLARHSMSCERLPDTGGDRPQVVVTISWDELRDAVSPQGSALAGIPAVASADLAAADLGPETARRLACDAEIMPAVLGSDGAVLDFGRGRRIWSRAQRRAARLRDGGCVFPHCQAGLDRCDLHHLDHWAQGGRTDLANSAHVCHFHHWLVHHTPWQISRDRAGRVVVSRM